LLDFKHAQLTKDKANPQHKSPQGDEETGHKGPAFIALLQWRNRVLIELLALLEEDGSLLLDR
jgi:hypothetical protein